jgi:DNA-binding XRE family transcriptional regulator
MLTRGSLVQIQPVTTIPVIQLEECRSAGDQAAANNFGRRPRLTLDNSAMSAYTPNMMAKKSKRNDVQRIVSTCQTIELMDGVQRETRRALQRVLTESLRPLRESRDVSLRSLAKLLGITPSYLSDIENDRRLPSAATASKIRAWAESQS